MSGSTKVVIRTSENSVLELGPKDMRIINKGLADWYGYVNGSTNRYAKRSDTRLRRENARMRLRKAKG
jgi:hypothetical protein